MFGYFPTYALGNLYAAQFYETAVAQEPAIGEEMALGKTDALVGWLRENIHQHGKKFTPRELVQRVTGRPLGYEAFMRYATTKFSAIYEL
jgi:carboxypeptidase Taq